MQDSCITCGGSGVVEGVKEVKVTIPAGWFLILVTMSTEVIFWLELINVPEQSEIKLGCYCSSFLFRSEILYIQIIILTRVSPFMLKFNFIWNNLWFLLRC